MNDFFLQMVRTETHRGLEGRAIGGFSTGGRVYGYSTETEPNPPDLEHPRKIFVVHPEEAAVLKRIFTLHRDGTGLKKIANILNEERIRAPYDGGEGNKRHGHGWSHTTIRAMLRNERYIGHFTWNVRKFVRIPGLKNRRAVRRPEAEVKRSERPDLAIIDSDLWQAVQARFRPQREPGQGRTGRPAGTGRRAYLLAGILKCGWCGGGFSVTGQQKKNGITFVNFGCMTHHNRGQAICPNNLHVSVQKITRAVLAALTTALKRPGMVQRYLEGLRGTLANLQKRARSGESVNDLQNQIAQVEQRIRNVTGAIARMGLDDDLEVQLNEEKVRLQALRGRRTKSRAEETKAKVIPHPKAFKRFLDALLETLEKDPAKGRVILARYVKTVQGLRPPDCPRRRRDNGRAPPSVSPSCARCLWRDPRRS